MKRHCMISNTQHPWDISKGIVAVCFSRDIGTIDVLKYLSKHYEVILLFVMLTTSISESFYADSTGKSKMLI